MDSYDDFYYKRRNGKGADPVYIKKVKHAIIMQVRALVWCFGGSVVVVCVCVCVCVGGITGRATWTSWDPQND